jgi:hypothetical protein
MPKLEIFTAQYVEYLESYVAQHLDQYHWDAPWAESLKFPADKTIVTKIEWDPDAVPLEAEDSVVEGDIASSISLHRALSELTAAQATDERLWARLCHVEFWPYMRARWPIERFAADSRRARQFLLSRYFVPQSQGRALMRNGLARLWWAAHLTVDYERDNAYELTAVLLSKLDIAKNLLERSLGRSNVILKAFLEFLQLNADRLLVPGDASRKDIRRLSRYLNLIGGSCLLDALSSRQIIDLLNRELDRMVAEEAPLFAEA